MSSASARVGATHIATSSPTWRTLSGGEHRLLGNLEARQPRHRADRLDADEIGCGEDAVAIALGHVNAANARMRQRAAHEGDVLQSGEPDVGDELAAPAHQAVVLLARQPRADALPGVGRKENRARCAPPAALQRRHDRRQTVRPRPPAAGSARPRRSGCRRAGRTPAAAGARRSPRSSRCRAARSGRASRRAPRRRLPCRP